MNLGLLYEGGETQWAMHTTMNLDYLYAIQMLEMQKKGSDIADVLEDGILNRMAVFYNKKTSPSCTGESMDIPIWKIKRQCFPVDAGKTLHAKCSLVCLKKDQKMFYRFGIYSKNMTFAGQCAEVGAVFDMEFSDDQEKESASEKNGKQLADFLRKLADCTSEEGRTWLENRKLLPGLQLFEKIACGFRLKVTTDEESGPGEEAELLFGGCTDEKRDALWQILELEQCDQGSLVLTPPVFIKGTGAEDFLLRKTTPDLYDLKKNERFTASHSKLYLLKKKNRYELYFGSANCTSRGIGWAGDNKNASIEALVKCSFSEKMFENWKEEISSYYEPIENFENGSLKQKTSDFWGDLLTQQGTVTEVTYYDGSGNPMTSLRRGDILSKIEYTLELSDACNMDCSDRDNYFSFHPLEYKKTCRVEINGEDTLKKIILTYEIGSKFRFVPSQKMLVIGENDEILWIPDQCFENVEVCSCVPLKRMVGDVLSRAWEMEEEEAVSYIGEILERLKKRQLVSENPEEMNDIIKDMKVIQESLTVSDMEEVNEQ